MERVLVYHAWNSHGLVRNHHYKHEEGTQEIYLQVKEFPLADPWARVTIVDRSDPKMVAIGVSDTSMMDAEDVIRTFEVKVGMTTDEFIKEYEETRVVCPTCGSEETHHDIGYPGEVLTACNRCGRILDCEFDDEHI